MNAEAEQALLKALDGVWDEYRAQFKAGRRGITEESIHDLRVAARRFLALQEIIAGLAPRPRVKRLRRFLKRQLNELDGLRDAQVTLLEASQKAEGLPGLEPFQAYLEKRVERLRRRAHRDLQNSKPSDLQKRLKRMRAVTEKHAGDAGFFERLLLAVDESHARVMKAFTKLDAGEPTTIHQVRIAFKELRYMIEALLPVLPGYPKGYRERMRSYQDAMGRVRDTTVFLDALKEFEKSAGQTEPDGQAESEAGPIEDLYQKRLVELIESFFERRDEVHMFWRAAPDQPFPWEKSDDPLYSAPWNRGATRQPAQRAGRQPAASHGRRAPKDEANREGPEENGGGDRPDPDEPLPSGA